MGSRVRIRLFHILHFVRDLLFPLLKNSKCGVDDRVTADELPTRIGVEILKFCRNQTLKRIERLSNYALVIPSSFILSTILYHSKVFPPALKLIL